MSTRLLLFAFVLTNLLSRLSAQHCGYDNAYIIILEVRDSLSKELINGLDIIVTDSAGTPYTSDWNLRNHSQLHIYQPTDTLKFGQNIVTDDSEFSAVDGPFPFGANLYMLIVYYNNYPSFNASGSDRLLITDNDGIENLGHFRTRSVEFGQGHISSLCTSSAIWHEQEAVDVRKIVVNLTTVD